MVGPDAAIGTDIEGHPRRRTGRLGGADTGLHAPGDRLADDRRQVGEPRHADIEGAQRQLCSSRQRHVGASGGALPGQRVERQVQCAIGELGGLGPERQRRPVEGPGQRHRAFRCRWQMPRIEQQVQRAGRHGGGARIAVGGDVCRKIGGRAGGGPGEGQRTPQAWQRALERGQAEAELRVQHVGAVGAGRGQVQRLAVELQLAQHQVGAILAGGERDLPGRSDQPHRLRLAAGDRQRADDRHVRLRPGQGQPDIEPGVTRKRHPTGSGERRQVGQRHHQLPMQGRGGGDPAGDAGKRVRHDEVQRPAASVRVERRVEGERIGRQQGRLRARNTDTLGHSMQMHRPGILRTVETCGQPLEPGIGGGQVVQHQVALAGRRLWGALQVRVERHPVPGNPRHRLHRGCRKLQLQVEPRLHEVERPVGAERQHAGGRCTGGRGKDERRAVPRSVEIERQAQRVEDRQVRQCGDEAAGRVVDLGMQCQPPGGHQRRQRDMPRMVEPLQDQADVGIRQRCNCRTVQDRRQVGDPGMAVDRGTHRSPGHGRSDIDALDLQPVDLHAEMQPALLPRLGRWRRLGVRVGYRQSRHLDPRRTGQLDMRVEAEQAQRRPVQHQVVDRQPGAARVVDLDAVEGQRVREAPAEAMQRHQPAGQPGRLALDQPTPGPGIGADQKQSDERHRHTHQ